MHLWIMHLWNHPILTKTFPIGSGQTISQPYTVAFQTMLLGIQKVIKCWKSEQARLSGGNTLQLGAKVFSIEGINRFLIKAKTLLEKLGYMPKIHLAMDLKGFRHFAPFDKIIITCGADIPQLLFEQLKTGGVMVVPVGEDVQIMKTVVKNLIKPWKSQTSIHFLCSMLGNKSAVSTFCLNKQHRYFLGCLFSHLSFLAKLGNIILFIN